MSKSDKIAKQKDDSHPYTSYPTQDWEALGSATLVCKAPAPGLLSLSVPLREIALLIPNQTAHTCQLLLRRQWFPSLLRNQLGTRWEAFPGMMSDVQENDQ